jgi:hypothetical protein
MKVILDAMKDFLFGSHQYFLFTQTSRFALLRNQRKVIRLSDDLKSDQNYIHLSSYLPNGMLFETARILCFACCGQKQKNYYIN